MLICIRIDVSVWRKKLQYPWQTRKWNNISQDEVSQTHKGEKEAEMILEAKEGKNVGMKRR